MARQQYITPEVQVNTMINPTTVICVSMQYDPFGGNPIEAV